MCTVRNAFDLIYKGKLISYYVYEQVSSSKKTLRLCDIIYNYMTNFYEQVCVRKRTLEEIAANCDSRIQRMRSRQTQKHINLMSGAYFITFIFETVQPLI